MLQWIHHTRHAIPSSKRIAFLILGNDVSLQSEIVSSVSPLFTTFTRTRREKEIGKKKTTHETHTSRFPLYSLLVLMVMVCGGGWLAAYVLG